MFVNRDIDKTWINLWLVSIYSLLILMIVVGGLTRLTDSGLSITKWELFTGILPPLNDQQWDEYFSQYKKIPEFIYLNNNFTMSDFKVIFYWEYFHRLLGRVIGLLSIIPLLFFVFKFRNKQLSLKKYFSIFILVCFQGFIGWYMVQSGLIERVDVSHFRLALHLFLAFVILSICFWFILEISDIKKFNYKITNFILVPILILLYIQIILGAFLAGLDGGLIYNTWPDMNGNLIPNDTKLVNFFSIEAFSTPSIIQFIHRKTAYLLLILIIFFNIIYFKKSLPKGPIFIFDLLILAQIFLGIITLLSGARIFYSSLHQICSVFVVSSFLYILYKNYKINLQPSN